ncbi:gamma-glutamyltransferase family protein [Rhizobium oryzicola]|uniref:Gamma-glutamyltransferase family protein n=1 Tax=Rhizobium oryzicola TaxID=1232668 RepID=A0ABT8SYR1_9HYPH|nr:gamma-glutamyltransferase family protein [Rhizobium oryzicola]MDO1583570.1 gamma-glutamyltransferase family protein [Rhizobium oryzicola]
MVTSPDPLASQIGADVLKNGGTAIEAAVAIGAALTVVTPHFCGLGGDAVWLVADETGRSSCFLGIGQAGATPPMFSGAIPLRGAGSTLTTACVVDSWDHALGYSRANWGGTLSFTDVLEPAAALADQGFAISRSQQFWTDFRKDEWLTWPGFAATFGGSRAQEPFRQPHLAQSFRLLLDEGPRGFYEGRLAQMIVKGLAAAGSPLTARDLASTRTEEVDVISINYRGHQLLAPPPPTQGAATLAIMGILERLAPDVLREDANRYHALVEAVKSAFLDRDAIADPRHAQMNMADILNPEHLASRAESVDMARAMEWPRLRRDGDTVFFAARDAKGRCASVLQSTYFDWGSGVVVGDTGIVWQNRGAAFSTVPGHPNEIQPGKRPFYTLNPGIALKDGKPRYLYGTQGADGQPQTLSVLLSGLIDRELTPEQALAQPRFLLGKTFSDSRDSLKLEASLGEVVMDDLAARGHEIAVLPALSPIFGQAGVIAIAEDRSVTGAHDPRGEGLAVGG